MKTREWLLLFKRASARSGSVGKPTAHRPGNKAKTENEEVSLCSPRKCSNGGVLILWEP